MNIVSLISTYSGACVITLVVLLVIFGYLLSKKYSVKYSTFILGIGDRIIRRVGDRITKSEASYARDLQIGKINRDKTKVKTYKFLNDMCIDLNLSSRGITPYGFLATLILITAILSIVLCLGAMRSIVATIIFFPLIFIALVCWLYTRANVAHDARIEAIIQTENIIANNIKSGVKVAIKDNLHMIPENIRGAYEEFLTNLNTNEHIRIALLELNNKLGSVSDSFIKNCITFETEEEHGMIDMFQDIVDINNTKLEARTDMKRIFEEKTADFIMSALLIFAFLFIAIAVFPIVRNFYFGTLPGNVVLALDALILIIEFVYTTYLRAKEL